MKYTKKPFTKLHHIEQHPNDDGTVTVEAHLMHNPPAPDGKKAEHMVPPMHDYPNKKFTATADDWEEAGQHSQAIGEAHQHEKIRGHKSEPDEEEIA